MAMSRILRPRSFFTLLLVVTSTATALQVTPDSPCAAACQDSADLDRSDASSSNTRNSDISCEDVDYTNESSGRKYKECMTCLQDSTFSKGEESDLDWFLYNLRYTFAFCIFGYPNATGIGSNPCMTSEACGPLEGAFTNGLKNPSKNDDGEFAYCTADGRSIFEDTYPSCFACVKSDEKRRYLSNFLVALEAGCEQHPSINHTITLNDTIFAPTTPTIINSTTAAEDSAKSGNSMALPIGAIIGIVIGAFIFIALVIGCVFLQMRKRRNRREKEELEQHIRSSALEFHCATHVNPFSPGFRNSNDGWHDPQMQQQPQEEYQYQYQYQQEGAPEQTVEVVDEKHHAGAGDALHSHPPEGPVRNFSRKDKQPTSITTTMELTEPSAALTSSSRRESPSDYGSPASATSTRSNVPFLASYNNNNRAAMSPGSPSMTYSAMPKTSSPLVQQAEWGNVRGDDADRTCAPVAARQIQTSFPPPPKR